MSAPKLTEGRVYERATDSEGTLRWAWVTYRFGGLTERRAIKVEWADAGRAALKGGES